MDSLIEYVNQNVLALTDSEIFQLKKEGATNVNNVIRGIRKEAFVVALDDDEFASVQFTVYYVNGVKKLKGYAFAIDTSDQLWSNYVYKFSKFLSEEFKGLDSVRAYNCILHCVHKLFEQLGFFTYTNLDSKFLRKRKLEASILMPISRGTIFINYLDRFKLFQSIFRGYNPPQNLHWHNTIYLIYNAHNDSVTIRKSVNPKAGVLGRAKIITYWVAPEEEEGKLHKIFKRQRISDVWFDLNVSDLRYIRRHMKKYER